MQCLILVLYDQSFLSNQFGIVLTELIRIYVGDVVILESVV